MRLENRVSEVVGNAGAAETVYMSGGAAVPDKLRHIDDAALRALTARAASEPRRRAHLLLHSGHDDGVQRLLIAGQPGTYVRPHVHSQQWEMLAVLAGAIDVLTFSEAGALLARTRLTPQQPLIQIPQGTWHGAAIPVADTVILEVKPGPYRANEFADWAPPEGAPKADAFAAWMMRANVGEACPA
jgi:cupin fold WbuC family metalloprotein